MRRLKSATLATIGAGLLLGGCGSTAGTAHEHLQKGKAPVAEGKYEAAVPELTRAVELDKDSIDAHTELGNAYRGLKRHDKAFEAYRAAKKVNRYVVRPHLENARALIENGQVELAIDQLNHVIELDAKNLEAMLLLGHVSMMPRPLPAGGAGVPRESLERAELNFETALGLAPDNVEAHRGLAVAREKLGQTAAAREAWTKARELAGNRPEHTRVVAEAIEALARLKP